MNSETDIVTLLRKYQPYSKLHGQAADEIERLRKALQLAVGELSTHNDHRFVAPDMLYEMFLDKAHHSQQETQQ